MYILVLERNSFEIKNSSEVKSLSKNYGMLLPAKDLQLPITNVSQIKISHVTGKKVTVYQFC